VDPESPLLRPLASWRPTLVAGSTWPADESVLFAAWPAVLARVPGARLMIAPHEPSRGHLAAVEDWAREAGLSLARLSAGQLASADVILVDRVGVLGQLYRLAGAAMVGGGFHGAGLHSVLEPAAFGAPVVCGPRDPHQRDAARLADVGGLVRVPDALMLAAVLATWLGNPAERRAAGDAARETVRRHLGAAAASVALVERLVAGG
jgi:3-deoxy-D-manno-octulosonic-acid transferase